jgi:hypothetical protein
VTRAPSPDEWRALVDSLICEHCGTKPERRAGRAPVLFHHRDPATKIEEVTKMATRIRWATTLAEIAKCDVVCGRCHRAAHPGYRWPPTGDIALPKGAMRRKSQPQVRVEGSVMVEAASPSLSTTADPLPQARGRSGEAAGMTSVEPRTPGVYGETEEPRRALNARGMEAYAGGHVKDSTPPASVTHLLPERRIREMRDAAMLRDFAVNDLRRQEDIRHGYLLALEEIIRP